MENEQNGDIGSFLAGFIIGGLVGAAVALILAPQSGPDTRNRLASESAHLREVGSERLHTARDSAQGYVSEARDRAQTTATHVQEQARIVLDEGKTHLGVPESSGAGDSGSAEDTMVTDDNVPPGDESGDTA